eukprot:1462774-Rhodomonas_salina.1
MMRGADASDAVRAALYWRARCALRCLALAYSLCSRCCPVLTHASPRSGMGLSLIHISEPTRPRLI